jgi:hypothetical protein
LGNSGNFGKNQENSAETQLTYKRNRKTLRNRNSVEFTELSAAFTNNLLTFTENRPGDFRANNVKNQPNYPENRALEWKNHGKQWHDIY